MSSALALMTASGPTVGPGTRVVVIILVCAVVVAFLVFFFGALTGILRSRLSSGMKAVWIVIAFCAPFLGCLAWYFIGRRDAERGSRV